MAPDVPSVAAIRDGTANTHRQKQAKDPGDSTDSADVGLQSQNYLVTSTSSIKSASGTGLNVCNSTAPIRRFKPELIETSRWRRAKSTELSLNDASQPTKERPRRFVPELLETTRKIRRKFEPQLVETAKRSRRIGDTAPALTSADRTDVVPCSQTVIRRKRVPRDLTITPVHSLLLSSPQISKKEARKRGITLPKRSLSSSSGLYYHYKSPDLDTIESSESDRSSPPSPSSSHSPSSLPYSSSPVPQPRNLSNRSSGRLLAVAAANAERQLKANALAAFPNDDRHQSIQHYVDLDHTPNLSSYSTMYEVESVRHQSTNWELKEIIHHHEKLDAEREEEQKRRDARRRLHQHLDKNPWAMPVPVNAMQCNGKKEGKSKPQEIEATKKIRPPMLGKDIEFPRSESPDPARFDVTQGPESLKKSMCYLSEQSGQSSSSGGLWSPRRSVGPSPNQWSRPASRAPSNGGGLWGGSCIDSGIPASRRPSGLMTPLFEDEQNSFPKDSVSLLRSHLPPSPPASNSGKTTLEESETEIPIEAEFNNHFVTQVYNYMSLGYPAIARDFDEELSKITRITVEELRQDDHLPNSRGYIRLGEDAELSAGVTEENCVRWRALRLYIFEWARQQPKMAKPRELETGWVAARKGSWAW